MHHFIYPTKDTYITNQVDYVEKNFGIDPNLEIKSNKNIVSYMTMFHTTSISESQTTLTNIYKLTGSVNGYLSGSITGSSYLVVDGLANITGSYVFNGILTASINGTATTASVVSQSGHIIGLLDGSITGSWKGYLCNASGTVDHFSGVSQAVVDGIQYTYSPMITSSLVPEFSRALIKFDISSISQSISNRNISNTASLQFKLNLKIMSVDEVPLEYAIHAYPISQSWEMGNGKYLTNGTAHGASWKYKNFSNSSGSVWYPYTASTSYLNVDYLNSASYASESFKRGGGTWYYSIPSTYTTASSGYCAGIDVNDSLMVTQSYNYETSDINMDITDIVNSWICGCIPNEGIILMSSLELSQDETDTGTLKFFSKDTNTIYSPYIDTIWDDSSYSTGSLVAVSETASFNTVVRDLNKNYKYGSIPRINIFARSKYILKNFIKDSQMNQYLTSSLLPTSSYYAIKDNESENMVIDFDSGTKLSCDGNMHYFRLDTTSLSQERFYRILIKVITNNETQIFDNGYVFKVTR